MHLFDRRLSVLIKLFLTHRQICSLRRTPPRLPESWGRRCSSPGRRCGCSSRQVRWLRRIFLKSICTSLIVQKAPIRFLWWRVQLHVTCRFWYITVSTVTARSWGLVRGDFDHWSVRKLLFVNTLMALNSVRENESERERDWQEGGEKKKKRERERKREKERQNESKVKMQSLLQNIKSRGWSWTWPNSSYTLNPHTINTLIMPETHTTHWTVDSTSCLFVFVSC